MRGSAVSGAGPGTSRPPARAGTCRTCWPTSRFGEEYNAACFDEDIPTFFERYTSRGASDINGFNALGVTDRADRTPDELLAEWRAACARTRTELRGLDGGDLTTGAGPYPARWQAWHLASELATHADDIGVPESPDEAADRARVADRVRPLRAGRDAAGGHGRGRAGRGHPRAGRRSGGRRSTTPS